MRRNLPFTCEEEARLAIQSQLDQGFITKTESAKEDYFKRLVIEKEYERGWRELPTLVAGDYVQLVFDQTTTGLVTWVQDTGKKRGEIAFVQWSGQSCEVKCKAFFLEKV